MRRVLTPLFLVFFGLSSLVLFVFALGLWLVTAPFDRDRRVNHLFSCAWASLYVLVYPGWRVRTTGRSHIAVGRPYVIVANHTSVADIVLLFGLFRQFKWLSKQEVFRYPILGWNMRLCRYVSLLRGKKDSIHQAMEACRNWLSRGISIVMFPEGTRSADGRLGPFKRGAFSLARECGVPVVPVAIHGGHQLIPKHGRSLALRADLWVEVLPPIPSQGFEDDQALADCARQRIAEALKAPWESYATETAPAAK